MKPPAEPVPDDPWSTRASGDAEIDADPTADRAPIVFLDIETTSLHPDLGRPWEIAMIRRELDGAEHRRVILIDDVDLAAADEMALRIGRFDERHPVRNPAVAAALIDDELTITQDGVVTTVKAMGEHPAAVVVDGMTAGAHLVGANVGFDAERLARMLRRHGRAPAWDYHLTDVETCGRAVLWQRGRRFGVPYKSADIARALGIPDRPEDDRHTALSDAAWARDQYDAIYDDPAPAPLADRATAWELGHLAALTGVEAHRNPYHRLATR